ncbi:MAG: 4Fe-4S dicluster domain-containing protein [Chloroflexi bacterium]|nr:4Fe-4S dicluster domain-containing protein [Chloroflexota bacterium]
MVKEIVTVVERCVACKACEIACAVEHSATKSLIGALFETPRSEQRVRVMPAGGYSYAVRCMHCEDAPCIIACPTGAMQRYSLTDSVFVDESRCIGCWMCTVSCPFGAVTANRSYQTALKCDRCPDRVTAGQEPACVEACPTQALLFTSVEEVVGQKRDSIAVRAIAAATASQKQANVPLWRTLKGAM